MSNRIDNVKVDKDKYRGTQVASRDPRVGIQKVKCQLCGKTMGVANTEARLLLPLLCSRKECMTNRKQ
jgi:hypothetical protein